MLHLEVRTAATYSNLVHPMPQDTVIVEYVRPWVPSGRMYIVSTELLDRASGWLGRADMTTAADGTWILVYRQASSHQPVADAHYVIRHSIDEGRTWTLPNQTVDGEPVTGFPYNPDHDTNDAIVTCLSNGDLLFLSGDIEPDGDRLEPRQLRSTDGGRHWSDEGTIPMTGYPDTERSLKPQDATTFGDTVYLAHHVDPGGDRSRPFHSGLTASNDGGRSWRYVADITELPRDTNEVGLAAVDGELVAIVRDMDGRRTWIARSNDDGETWIVADATAQLGIMQRAKLTTTTVGDQARLIAFGRHHVDRRDRRNAIAYSDDAGRTWCGPFDLDTGLANSGYNGLLPRVDGRLYTVVYRGTADSADLYGITVSADQRPT